MVDDCLIPVYPDHRIRRLRQECAAVSLPAANIQDPLALRKTGREEITMVVFQGKKRIGLMRDESFSCEYRFALGIFFVSRRHSPCPFSY